MTTLHAEGLRAATSSAVPDVLRRCAHCLNDWNAEMEQAVVLLRSAARHEVAGLAGPAAAIRVASDGQRAALERVASDFATSDVGHLLGIALDEAGYVEGRNDATKYGRWYGLPNSFWCAMFVSWSFAKAGRPLPPVNGPNGFASVRSGWEYAIRTKRRIWTPKPGDIFFIDHGGGRGHTGIVVSVDPATGTMVTIEGNTNAAGFRNGTMVRSKTRKISVANQGFWRPFGSVEDHERVRPPGRRSAPRRRRRTRRPKLRRRQA